MKLIQNLELSLKSQFLKFFIPYFYFRRSEKEIFKTLYDDLPYQCSCCGTRFEQSPQLAKHLDAHYRNNIYLRERKIKHENRPPLTTVDVIILQVTSIL